jgi:hypothetical protein
MSGDGYKRCHMTPRAILVTVALSGFMGGQAAAMFIDGNDLSDACEKSLPFFSGYIAAVYDAMDQPFLTAGSVNAQKLCVVEGVRLTQLVDTVKLWLHDHPEKRHLAASFLVFQAFKEKFPCN